MYVLIPPSGVGPRQPILETKYRERNTQSAVFANRAKTLFLENEKK